MDQVRQMYASYRDNIVLARSVIQLRQLRNQFHDEFHTLQNLDGMTGLKLLNDLFDLFIKHVVILTEEQLNQKHGLAGSPAPYAFLLFGSAGRREQVPGSDQDNGLIYKRPEGSPNGREIDHYFERFGELLVANLLQLGFAECEGRVLCAETKWRKHQQDWTAQIDAWLDDPTFEFVRNLLVVTDGRCLHGEEQLFDEMRHRIYRRANSEPDILAAMLRNTLHRKVLIGVFGQLVREQHGEAQGGVDLKYGAYVPFVNAIRMLAIRYRIPSSSTVKRIRLLADYGHIDEEMASGLTAAFSDIVSLRTLTFLEDHEHLFVSGGKLKSSQLTAEHIKKLKRSMKIAKHLQQFTQKIVERETGGSSPWI